MRSAGAKGIIGTCFFCGAGFFAGAAAAVVAGPLEPGFRCLGMGLAGGLYFLLGPPARRWRLFLPIVLYGNGWVCRVGGEEEDGGWDGENGGRLKIHAVAGARLGKGYMVGHCGVTISGMEVSRG